MAARGIVALEFIVDLRRCTELLFEAVCADQRRRAEHSVKIADLLRNRDIAIGVIQFLLGKLAAEDLREHIERCRLMRFRIEQRSRFFLHICAEIIPCFRHFGFGQIDLVRDFIVLCHGYTLLFEYCGRIVRSTG